MFILNLVPTNWRCYSGWGKRWPRNWDLLLSMGLHSPWRNRTSLGVLLDLGYLLDKQEAVVAKAAFHQLWLVSQWWPFLGEKYLASVMHALATSRLDYSGVLCNGLPLKTAWKQHPAQNAVTRMLAGVVHWDHFTPVSFQLQWLPCSIQGADIEL